MICIESPLNWESKSIAMNKSGKTILQFGSILIPTQMKSADAASHGNIICMELQLSGQSRPAELAVDSGHLVHSDLCRPDAQSEIEGKQNREILR
jgi:hypothetical protein